MYDNRSEHDILLESMVTTYYADIKYDVLTESEKLKAADQLITKLFKDIKNKTLKMNDKDIEKTKGDFSKHPNYKELCRALRFLEESANSQNNAGLSEKVKVLRETEGLLISNKDVFKNAFQYGNDVLVISYFNICAGLIIGISECISLNTQIIQSKKYGADSVGNRSFGGKSNYIEGLKSANAVMKSNKLRMINDTIVVKNESFTNSVKNIWNSTKIPRRIGLGVAGVYLLLSAVKRICFTYFHQRVKLADHLRNTAEYVQLKSDGVSDNNIKAKQQKWIDKLLAFAEKVDVDSTNANAKADADIKSSDQEMSELPTTWIM